MARQITASDWSRADYLVVNSGFIHSCMHSEMLNRKVSNEALSWVGAALYDVSKCLRKELLSLSAFTLISRHCLLRDVIKHSGRTVQCSNNSLKINFKCKVQPFQWFFGVGGVFCVCFAVGGGSGGALPLLQPFPVIKCQFYSLIPTWVDQTKCFLKLRLYMVVFVPVDQEAGGVIY